MKYEEATSSGKHLQSMELDALLKKMASSRRGLTQAQASERLQEYGLNTLDEERRPNQLFRFLKQFHHLLIYVLLCACVTTAFIGQWADAIVIFAVVLLNALIGFIQEGRADAALASIRSLLAPQAKVLRDNSWVLVDASSVVPGDIVQVVAGDRVPADGRLLEVNGLVVNEAILTGESIPVQKEAQPKVESASLLEQSGMVFMGTSVTQGIAKMVVVATGSVTEMGHISKMVSGVQEVTTPLVHQMSVFSRYLTIIILSIAALILLAGELMPHLGGFMSFGSRLMAVVGLSVAAIPEGLPAILTITLAVGVKVMARNKAIVKTLPSIETLGAVSVICTDKTGTLTCNEMMVVECWASHQHWKVSGEGYEPFGAVELQTDEDEDTWPALRELARIGALCNDAQLVSKPDTRVTENSLASQWNIEGDPMEGALLVLEKKVQAALSNTPEDRGSLFSEHWKRVTVVPFDAKHRYMLTVDQSNSMTDSEEGAYWIHMKGAPETLFGLMPHADSELWQSRIDDMANQGRRVLALAKAGPFFDKADVLQCARSHSLLAQHLEMAGLIGLIDPPRPEVKEAIAACQAAGISVKMITGDHIKTAQAIARQIGLVNTQQAVLGAELETLPSSKWPQLVKETNVFARTNPAHKLGIVQALQSEGLTVAMTGDGVNDAPALKQADAGVAMGQTGSDVAREAADLILTDDHFASIVAAVAQGRTVYENVKKVIAWTLPTSAGEAMVIVFALLAGWSLPIAPIQILWVNLITVTTLGVVLAFEPTEPGTMQRPPRPRSEPLVDGGLLWHMVVVSALFIVLVFAFYGQTMAMTENEAQARTMAVNLLVVLEIFHLLFIRTLYQGYLGWNAFVGARWVWLAVVIVLAAQTLVTYWPKAQVLFQTTSLTLGNVVSIMLAGAGFLIFLELERRIRTKIVEP